MASKPLLYAIFGIISTVFMLGILGFTDFNEIEPSSDKNSIQPFTKTTVNPVVSSIEPNDSVVLPQSISTNPSITDINNSQEVAELFGSIIKKASAIPSSQLTVTSTQWSPASGLWIATDAAGDMYFNCGATELCRLSISTNTVTRWGGFGVGTQELRKIHVDTSGLVCAGPCVYAAVRDSNFIARLDPTSNVLTKWQVPTAGSLPNDVVVDSSGMVYFTEADFPFGKVGRLDPTTNTITEWRLPSINSAPGTITIDASDTIYFTETFLSRTHKIGTLDVNTNTFTEWEIPAPSHFPHDIVADPSGKLYFTERSESKVGRLDPSTNVFTEWDTPSVTTAVEGTAVDSAGIVYFIERAGVPFKIARLDPSTNLATEWDLPFGQFTEAVVDPSDDVFIIGLPGVLRLS